MPGTHTPSEMLKAQDEGISARLDSRLDAMRSEARKRDPNYKPPEPPKKKVVKVRMAMVV